MAGGRPRQGEEVKLAPLNMRTSPELRAKIEEAADANGRSLTQEVERRLFSSFTLDQYVGRMHIQSLTLMLGAAVSLIEDRTGKRWTEDQETWIMVSEAVMRLLRWDRPPPDSDQEEEWEIFRESLAASEKEKAAREALEAYRKEHGIPDVTLWTPAPRKGLFGSAPRVPSDPREDWTEDQRREEMRLIEEERAAAQLTRSLNDKMLALRAPRLEREAAAKKAGEEVAEPLLALLGPKPRAARRREKD